MVGIACVTGFLVGSAAVAFKWLIARVHELFYSGFRIEDAGQWSFALLLIPLIVGIGGLITGILNYFFNPANETAAASEAMKWSALESKVPSRIIWYRFLASAATIGSGGSGGREGPIAQIGAAIGDWVGRRIGASSDRKRLLLGCGTAGAIAAAFNAPLGGLIFAIELIMGDFNIKVFSPLIFSAVIATVTSRHFEGDVPVFALPSYSLVSTWEVLFFIILGIGCGLLSALFYRIYFLGYKFETLKVHPIFLPAIGGVLVGVLGIFFPDVLGNGYGSMSKILTGNMGLTLALSLIFIKMIATSVTLGSRGSGGMFAPALFIGSMAGGAFGIVIHQLFPGITSASDAYALVGMGAVMAAAAHAPLTCILMGFELTNNYEVILPIMLACISSTFVYSLFTPNSIYQEKLRRVGVNIWQGRESAIMGTIRVSEVMSQNYQTVPENLPFKKILSLVQDSKAFYFPCIDSGGNMTGILSVQDVREFLFEVGLGDLVVAKELATEDVITIYDDETLNDAMEKFAIKDLDELPVVKRGAEKKIIGVVKRRDVMAAYKKAVLKKSI